MRKRYAIGIDPGVKTGFAIYDRMEKTLANGYTTNFWRLLDDIQLTCVWPNKYHDCLFVIETPKKTRLYDRQDKEDGHRRREKIAANAGGNAREAELLADGIERLGFEVRRVTPTRKKWTAEQLERYTGIKERTSQHVRDAIALVWGI